MTIIEYRDAVQKLGFVEHPYVIIPGEPLIESFVDFSQADIELKTYLVKVILARNFSSTGNGEVLTDHIWLIKCFLAEYESDPIRHWLTPTINDAIESVISEEVFTRNLSGTTFLFGVVEYYAKYILGWRPINADFFDEDFHEKYRGMTIEEAIIKLKKTNTSLARDLNAIDKHCTKRLKEFEIEEKGWIRAEVAGRLKLARNAMLHGELHSFYSIGRYLAVLYVLFYYHHKQFGDALLVKTSEKSASSIN